MKTLIATIILVVAQIASAQNLPINLNPFEPIGDQTQIISEQNMVLPVDISTTQVILSASDYSFPVVKVLVPELAGPTILNHQNTNAGAPCLATYETPSVDAVVQGNPAVEDVEFKITLRKHTYRNTIENKCNVTLTENIEATIRGFKFVHSRTQAMPDRTLGDCF
ncbi:MAG: hypothetical protein KDD33_03450 [Bdellovibrionales bacterium]|nr:hypothetical protein [Bdellovibrionales bacterium]